MGFSGSMQPAFCVALQDGNTVGLTGINGNSFRPAVSGQCLAKKAFGCGSIMIFAETELNRIAIAIDGMVEIHLNAFDLRICLAQVPFARDLTLSLIKQPKQLWTEIQNPAMRSRVVKIDAAFRHQLYQINSEKALAYLGKASSILRRHGFGFDSGLRQCAI